VTGIWSSPGAPGICNYALVYDVHGVLHSDGTYLLYATYANPPDPTHCASSIVFSGTVYGTGCDKATEHFSNNLNYQGNATMSHVCAIPSAESKPALLGWGYRLSSGPTPQTSATFQQNLLPYLTCNGSNVCSVVFGWGGRTIMESAPATPPGSDSCYYPNNFGIQPQTTVTGGYITLDPGVQYKDLIGSTEAVVLFYRGQLNSQNVRVPCGYQVHQRMSMLCSTGEQDGVWVPDQVLSFGIGTTNVSAIRGPSDKAERYWSPKVTSALINSLLLEQQDRSR